MQVVNYSPFPWIRILKTPWNFSLFPVIWGRVTDADSRAQNWMKKNLQPPRSIRDSFTTVDAARRWKNHNSDKDALLQGRREREDAFLQLQHSRDCERFYLPQLLSFFDGCCGGVNLKEFWIQRVESSCSFGLWLVRDQIQISTTDSSSTKRIPVEIKRLLYSFKMPFFVTHPPLNLSFQH